MSDSMSGKFLLQDTDNFFCNNFETTTADDSKTMMLLDRFFAANYSPPPPPPPLLRPLPLLECQLQRQALPPKQKLLHYQA